MPLPRRARAVAEQREKTLQVVEKLLSLTGQFSPALVQARASAPDLAKKAARSSLWKKLSLYRMTDCFVIRSIPGFVRSPRFIFTRASRTLDVAQPPASNLGFAPVVATSISES